MVNILFFLSSISPVYRKNTLENFFTSQAFNTNSYSNCSVKTRKKNLKN